MSGAVIDDATDQSNACVDTWFLEQRKWSDTLQLRFVAKESCKCAPPATTAVSSPTANAAASDATGDKSTSDMSEYANVTAEEQEAARAYLHHLLGDTDTAPPLDECGPYAEVLDTAAGLSAQM